MNTKTITGLLIFAFAFLSSCNKTADLVSDYPSVNITSPVTGQIFGKTTVHIAATVSTSTSDESHNLHEVNFTVRSVSDSTIVFSVWKSVHGFTSYNIDTSFTSTVTGDMLFVAEAENHLDKVTTKHISFSIN